MLNIEISTRISLISDLVESLDYNQATVMTLDNMRFEIDTLIHDSYHEKDFVLIHGANSVLKKFEDKLSYVIERSM